MRYNPALDGIRALAVLAVVACHCRIPFALGGFIGVDVFFVLSGFLITSLLVEEFQQTNRIGFGRFYLNRALRLWPPLALMLAAYVCAAPFLFPDANVVKTAAAALFYVSDLRPLLQLYPDPVGHTWSLGVEEKFYLLWPFVILALARLRRGQAIVILAALLMTAAIWRVYIATGSADWIRPAYNFDTNMAGLIAGALLAMSPWRPQGKFAAAVGIAGLAGIVFAVVTFRSQIQANGAGSLMVYAMASAIIAAAAERENVFSMALSWPPLVYVGTLSYSIYLWHYPVARFLRDRLTPEWTLLIVLSLVLAISASSYALVERPLKALRHRASARNARLDPAPAAVAAVTGRDL